MVHESVVMCNTNVNRSARGLSTRHIRLHDYSVDQSGHVAYAFDSHARSDNLLVAYAAPLLHPDAVLWCSGVATPLRLLRDEWARPWSACTTVRGAYQRPRMLAGTVHFMVD